MHISSFPTYLAGGIFSFTAHHLSFILDLWLEISVTDVCDKMHSPRRDNLDLLTWKKNRTPVPKSKYLEP